MRIAVAAVAVAFWGEKAQRRVVFFGGTVLAEKEL
jgi:hypothetical protein